MVSSQHMARIQSGIPWPLVTYEVLSTILERFKYQFLWFTQPGWLSDPSSTQGYCWVSLSPDQIYLGSIGQPITELNT